MSSIDRIVKPEQASKKSQQEIQKPAEVKRLKFFIDFIAMEDLTLGEVAKVLGMTRPAISHWISSDDAKLDQIQQLIESRGYEFEIFLTRDGEEADGRKRISLDDFITLKKSTYKPKRLSFLTLALRRYSIKKSELATMCGLAYSSVRYWFLSDTITISRLFQICEVANFSIRISITKKTMPVDNIDVVANGQGHRVCSILISKETIMKL